MNKSHMLPHAINTLPTSYHNICRDLLVKPTRYHTLHATIVFKKFIYIYIHIYICICIYIYIFNEKTFIKCWLHILTLYESSNLD